MKFSIGICGRGQNIHSACFEDFSSGLADALRELGHEVSDFNAPGRLILFGVHNSPSVAVPDDSIIFNAEQIASSNGDAQQRDSLFQHRSKVIWDYSQTNIAALRAAGFSRVVHCPIGYMPSMTKIAPVPVEDIDVLFYGSVNERRKAILDALEVAGLSVVRLFGVYGADRDAAIARAKVVLNLHYYDKPIFEIFRVSHLLANKKCVVSEDGGCDPELESFAGEATHLVSYDSIVDTCKRMVKDVTLRKATAAVGFFEFSQLSLVEHVRRALEQS